MAVDRRNMVWPMSGTGQQLAEMLRAAANATHEVSGGATDVVDKYLRWAGAQVRMLQGRLSPADLDRLITTRRYWATLADPTSVLTMVDVLLDELQHRRMVLEAATDAVSQQAAAWSPRDGQFTNYVLVDTNYWMEKGADDLEAMDWHEAVANASGPSLPAMQDELRIVVPLLVIDELDDKSHRRDTRPKVTGATKLLYSLLADHPGEPRELRAATGQRGAVTAQLLFDSLGHVRLSNNDDELVERLIVLRDFLGHPSRQMFFLTYDGGAAFRAGAAGLMHRHALTPPKLKNS
jgi:hypothetical protein